MEIDNKTQKYIEEKLEKIVNFYKKEIEKNENPEETATPPGFFLFVQSSENKSSPKESIIVNPVMGIFTDLDSKIEFAKSLKERIKFINNNKEIDGKVVCVASIMEVYISTYSSNDYSKDEIEEFSKVRPSEDPLSTEALLINLETQEHMYSKHFTFQRKDSKVTLKSEGSYSKLKKDKNNHNGLFTNLLPHDFSI